MSKLYAVVVSLLLFQAVSAQVTVHVLNPWRNDTCAAHRDSLRMGGNNYVGYFPGSGMHPEGGGWFYYTYREANLNFTIVNWCGPEDWKGRVTYNVNFRLDTMLMQFPKNTKELWILIPDSLSKPVISDKPPVGSKFIYFLNPWSIGAPQVVLKGLGAPRMRLDTSITRCGWFRYVYFGPVDSAQVKFMNSLDSTIFSSVGLGDGGYIDLSTALKTKDTAWVLPMPYPNGTPVVQSAYPGQSAPCERTLYLGATLRDLDMSTNLDVNIGESRKGCGADKGYNAATPGMVKLLLDANGKPVLADASPCEVTSFDWFTTQTIAGQYTNATCYNLKLTKNDEGLYEYDTNYFFPADSFLYLDDARTIPNPRYGGGQDNVGKPHNYAFTMELTAQFEYRRGQTFYFRGDDDVWVFINGKLVVDLGGVHNPMEGAVNLDTLGLTVGNTYEFRGFFVERNCCGSNFRMVTSLNLRTSSSLFTKATTVSPGVKKFDMFEKISKNNLSCDPGVTAVDTQKATVNFYLEGPSFPATPPTVLAAGTSYGGINIVGNSTVIIDTMGMTGLTPGNYLIRYTLSSDPSQGGTIPFTVRARPPDHVDLLVDAVTLDTKKDAVVDSIVIGMLELGAEAYAVIRDASGTYQNHATNPVWTVGDTTVVRVTGLAAMPSRCVLTKVGAGRTWLVVNHAPGLKPDSVLVITYAKPPYPVAVSGVMADVNADLVPDMLYLTMSDSLKADQRLDSVRISYRGSLLVVRRENVVVRGALVDVRLPENMGINARPEGSAVIFITVGSEVKSSPLTFTDGISPAVIAADVLENSGADFDILFVTLSEPVPPAGIIGRQLLLIKQAGGDTVAHTVMQVLAQINDSTFSVQVAPSVPGVKVQVGDRLRLVPGSAGGTLADLRGNKAHDLNRSVVVGFKPGAASIAGAWYRDVNADGIIDQVTVTFVRKIEQSEVGIIRVQRNAGVFTIPFSRAIRLSDSQFMVDVGDSIARLGSISTGGTMNISAEYIAFPGVFRNSNVADSAAPVIVSATMLPGAFTATGERGKDELVVTVSEKVVQFGVSPFLLSAKKDGRQYSFALEYLGENSGAVNSYRFTVLSITTSLPFASTGDTIWIDPLAGVGDTGGVIQKNPLNRRVLLKVDWPQAEWKIKISANPFTRNTTIPAVFGGGAGIAIVLVPTTPVDEALVRASVIIYDKVGNVVLKSDCTPFNNGYRVVWRGENRKGRYVANGTYLLMIRVDDGHSRELVKTLKIGFTQ